MLNRFDLMKSNTSQIKVSDSHLLREQRCMKVTSKFTDLMSVVTSLAGSSAGSAARNLLSKIFLISIVSTVSILAMSAGAGVAKAGLLFSVGPKWSVFSLEPLDEEATPNYQGVSGEMTVGYSFKQIFDMAGHFEYTPGTVGMVQVPGEGANLMFYGGQIAARIHNSVFFALRGGTGSYHLLSRTTDEEVSGDWSGPSGGFSIGGMLAGSKSSFIQVTFDFLHMILTQQDSISDVSGKRRVDQFSIGVNYTFNGRKSSMVENSFFSHYLNSFLFWE